MGSTLRLGHIGDAVRVRKRLTARLGQHSLSRVETTGNHFRVPPVAADGSKCLGLAFEPRIRRGSIGSECFIELFAGGFPVRSIEPLQPTLSRIGQALYGIRTEAVRGTGAQVRRVLGLSLLCWRLRAGVRLEEIWHSGSSGSEKSRANP